MGWGKEWRDYKPPAEKATSTAAPKVPKVKLDRGRGARGAKWQYVTPEGELIDYAQQRELHADAWEARKKTVARMGWILIQSRKEAKRYIGLLSLEREGKIRNLQRQVAFPLMVRRPDGLMETLGHWRADHTYDEADAQGVWTPIYEDVKGNPEDLYLWKKKHFEAQNGKRIREI